VFLLTREFTVRETAYIIDQPIALVLETRAAVEKAIDQQGGARILIAEDEEIIALDLQQLIEKTGHQVVGIAHTEREAIRIAVEKRPDLLLVDIKLGEGSSGIEAVKTIVKTMDVPTIFITAYPERLLASDFVRESVYLIAKPFLPETVQTQLRDVLFFHWYGLSGTPVRPTGSSPAGARNEGPDVADDEHYLRELVRNKSDLRAMAVFVMAALEPVLSYDPARHHNQPPPEMWIDHSEYLAHLRIISGEVKALVTHLEAQNPPGKESKQSIINLKTHVDTFLHEYAATLGKGAAIATFGLLALLLMQAGFGGQLVQQILRIAHLDTK
jgi:CheY-like chemotaxis protein